MIQLILAVYVKPLGKTAHTWRLGSLLIDLERSQSLSDIQDERAYLR